VRTDRADPPLPTNGASSDEPRARVQRVIDNPSRDRTTTVVASLLVAFVLGALSVSVLSGGVPRPASLPIIPRGGAAGTDPDSTAATPQATTDPDAEVTAFCLNVAEWRVYATEQWLGGRVRTWSSVEVHDHGSPGDPALPVTRLVSEAVTTLGYCAPISGSERPPVTTVASAWVTSPGHDPISIALTRALPVHASALGAAWLPPVADDTRATGWPPGNYTFRLADTATGYERWFAIEVEQFVAPSAH
jgi:hypothetical protein